MSGIPKHKPDGAYRRLQQGFEAFRPAASAILAVTAVLSLFLLLAGCKKEQKGPAPSSPEVTVLTVSPGDVPATFEFVAQTQSSHLVNIQARVSGFLDKRLYTEGAVVREGQLLFQMDPKPFQTQLDQARAALARQEAALETARLNLARTKPLTEQNALSQKDLDDAKGHYESTASAVEQARAQVETAKLNLSYTAITSPVTGVSSSALQTDGTYISPQNSLLTTVAVLSPMWVNFSISENEMQRYRNQVADGKVRPPKDGIYDVEVILVDGSVFPQRGRITFAEPSFNAQTGTFLVRATVENPRGVLRPNQYVRVRLKGAVRPGAILLPKRAVQQGSKGQFVWVVGKDNHAEQRPVEVGPWHGEEWLIQEGLGAGDRVVIDGGILLRSGMPVAAKPYETKQEGAQAGTSPGKKAPAPDTAPKGLK